MERELLAKRWLNRLFNSEHYTISRLSGDASFRRYYRLHCRRKTFLLMDAPPDKEDCHRFIDIGARLSLCGIKTPVVHRANLESGFLLLEDFGDQRYYDASQTRAPIACTARPCPCLTTSAALKQGACPLTAAR